MSETQPRGLSPERVEEILNARRERNGFMVASSDYDDLVLAYKGERTRADAAEAQRDRLAAALEGAMRALGAAHIVACDEPEWPTPCTPENCQVTAAVEDARAALADVPGHQGGHSVPAAESAADTDTLPDSTNATIALGDGESYADSTLSGKPIMPTLTDEEHAAIDRTLTRTHEARQARKRDEAYQAMVEALEAVKADAATVTTPTWTAVDAALALARQVEVVQDVLDNPDAMAAIQRGWDAMQRGEPGVPVSELRRKDDRTRRRDEAYRAMRDALVLVTQDGRHNSTMVWEAIDRALALAQQAEE